MEITDVKVIPVEDEKLKAFVSIVFDQCFVVTDIKVIHGPKGLFVSMPSKKRKDGTFKDIAHPLNNQMRQYLEEKVLSVYRQQVAGQPSSQAVPSGGAAPGGSSEGPAQGGSSSEGPAQGGSSSGGPAQGGSSSGGAAPGGSSQGSGGGAGSPSGSEQAPPS